MKNLIGFFDSGVGGISVLHAARNLLPRENYLYYGDNGNAPYGSRPVDEIHRLCEKSVRTLLARDVKAIVIACNTATSVYAETLRSQVDIPVIGMEPALKPAQLARHGGNVLVLATRATLSLPKFQRLMSLYGENAVPVVGTGLVELVENGYANTPLADETVLRLLEPFRKQVVDSIVLGCTHYPFLYDSVRKALPGVEIYDGRRGTVLRLKSLLESNGLLSCAETGTVEFQTSGDDAVLPMMRHLLRTLEHPDPAHSDAQACAKESALI